MGKNDICPNGVCALYNLFYSKTTYNLKARLQAMTNTCIVHASSL